MTLSGPLKKIFDELQNEVESQIIKARNKLEVEFSKREQDLKQREQQLSSRGFDTPTANEPQSILVRPASGQAQTVVVAPTKNSKRAHVAFDQGPADGGAEILVIEDLEDESTSPETQNRQRNRSLRDAGKGEDASNDEKRKSNPQWSQFQADNVSVANYMNNNSYLGKLRHTAMNLIQNRGRSNGSIPAFQTGQEVVFNEKTTTRVFEYKPVSKGNRKAAAIVHNGVFEVFITMMILINSAFLGMTVDYTAEHGRNRELPESFVILEKIFTIIFTVELILRIVGEGSAFVFSKNWKFHMLDTVIVVSACVEQIMLVAFPNNSAGENLSIFSMLRLLRLVRVARSVRLMQFSRDLRALVHGMLYCLKPLFWAIILLILLMFMFSVVLMEFAVDQFYDPYLGCVFQTGESCNSTLTVEEAVEICMSTIQTGKQGDTMPHFGPACELRWYFGNLPRTMLTLYKSISGGITWGEVAEPLKHISWMLVGMFCVYIGVVIFAVLNIVTSIFLENARKNTLRDKDHLVWEEVQERNWLSESFSAMFNKADESQDGYINCDEFAEHFEDPIVQAYLRALGVDVQSCGVKFLFNLLDYDASGIIDRQTFVAGCTHFRGLANSIEMQKMRQDIQAMQDVLGQVGGNAIKVSEQKRGSWSRHTIKSDDSNGPSAHKKNSQ